METKQRLSFILAKVSASDRTGQSSLKAWPLSREIKSTIKTARTPRLDGEVEGKTRTGDLHRERRGKPGRETFTKNAGEAGAGKTFTKSGKGYVGRLTACLFEISTQ